MTPLNSLVADVLKGLESEIHGRKIDWRIGTLPSVRCDPGLLQQAFANLLANAVKYTRRRKHAVIEVGQMTLNAESVIYVRDNGAGFDPKYAGKLFGAFQRLHTAEEFEGTGIGLATVQRIIRKHGGRVWAEAEQDKGATFYFTLGAEP
jgi:light-regulated signal transduction histidine kinase (bacteriophytochrome)